MKRNGWIGMLWVSAVAVVAIVVAGCETNSDVAEGVLTINPPSAQVTTNTPSVSFTASGGSGVYAWSVADPGSGTVLGSGNAAVYNARRLTNNVLVLGANLVVVTDDDGNTASASISPGVVGVLLTINPTTAKVTASSPSVSFTASGGTGVYTWSVVNPDVGTVISSGASAVYSAVTNILGANLVMVTDDGGHTASASITQ